MWLCVLLLIAGKAQAWISYPTAGYLTATNEDGISIEYEIFNIDGQMVASPWEVKDPTLVLNIPAEIVSRQGTVYPVTWIHALRCNNVSVLNLPNSIKIINSISADSLTYLRVPDSVTEISEDAFIYCPSLKKLFLPDNGTFFKNLFSLSLAYLEPSELALEEVSIGSLHNECLGKLFTSVGRYYDKYNVIIQNNTRYVLPPNLKKVTIRNQSCFADSALINTAGIEIDLCGNPIESFSEHSFYNSGVKELVFVDTVEVLPRLTTEAQKIVAHGVKKIKQETFDGMTRLKHLELPGLEELEPDVFQDLDSLEYLEISLPGPGTLANVGVFGDLFGHRETGNKRSVMQYFEDGDTETFYLPASLKELVLSEGCEMIPYGGLSNCNMIERLTLPTTLYMVGDKALYGCARLQDIYCKGAAPAVAYSGSFEGLRTSSCVLHIPYNTEDLYRRSTGWKDFYYFEEEAPLSVNVTKAIENGGVIYGLREYQLGDEAELQAVAHSGYVFEGWMEDGILLTSDNTYRFTVTESRNLIAAFAPVMDYGEVEITFSEGSATFAYLPVEHATEYVVDIYRDESMTDLFQSASSSTMRRTAEELTVSGLTEGTPYYYKLTAYSETGTTLAQAIGSFIAASGLSVGEMTKETDAEETGRYDLGGQRHDTPFKGLNLIRMSDGTVKKILIK